MVTQNVFTTSRFQMVGPFTSKLLQTPEDTADNVKIIPDLAGPYWKEVLR